MSEYSNVRILIIDGTPEIQKSIAQITSNLTADKPKKTVSKNREQPTQPHFQIDTVTQGRNAVEKITDALKDGSPYALVLVEIRRPHGLDRIEMIKHLGSLDPNIQIILCVSRSDYSWEEAVALLGENKNLLIIKKPYNDIILRQSFMVLMNKWQFLKKSHEQVESFKQQIHDHTHAYQVSLSTFRGVLESSLDGILILDTNKKIVDYNNKLLSMWNIPETLLESKKGDAILEKISLQVANPDEFVSFMKNFHGTSLPSFKKFTSKDRHEIEYFSQAYRFENKIVGYIWRFRDITALAAVEENKQAGPKHPDGLTELPNRKRLIDHIEKEIAKSKINNLMFGVLIVDLDCFKIINEKFGHTTGDELLKGIYNRILLSLRDNDILARLEGDEFVAVISSCKEADALIPIAKKILNSFNKAFSIMDHEIVVSPSIGITIYPKDGSSPEQLLSNADLALYRAKVLGGNHIQFYKPELKLENMEHLKVEADLRLAIDNQELFVCYQPLYDTFNNTYTSAEALIRWRHPEKGIVMPINFIPLAEETGLILPIGAWVLNEVCAQNMRWQKMKLSPVRIAVNIAASQFHHADFVDQVRNALHATGLGPKYLEIELKQNIIHNTPDASRKLSELHDLGVYITLDDFDPSNLSPEYLRTIRLDRLKISRSYVQNINVSYDDEVIIQEIISTAKNLNLDIVAEGVETQKQIEFLQAKQCNSIQGFYFSKPLLANEMENLLRNPAIIQQGSSTFPLKLI